MKIRHLKVSNWRSIKELDIDVADLMVVIGQNNHGKSNLLSSVLFFFGGRIQLVSATQQFGMEGKLR